MVPYSLLSWEQPVTDGLANTTKGLNGSGLETQER